jgi:glycosyltransferase involved in cell wall biosynthesis
MKVRLFHTLPGEGRTSSEVYTSLLAGALQELGDPDLELSHMTSSSRVRDALATTRITARLGGLADRYLTYQLRCTANSAAVNHIVDHGYAHLAFSLRPGRCVVSFHDALLLKLRAGEIPGMPGRPAVTVTGQMFSLAALRKCAQVITPSQSSREDLIRFAGYDPERITVIPLAPDDQFRTGSDGPARGDSESIRILSIGHSGPVKNLETTLKVVAAVAAVLGPKVTLVRVGQPFTPQQQRLIDALKIRDNIEYRGEPGFSDLPAIYASADLLLMPSHYEGFGLPVVEAMAGGVPVVASNAGSLPEVAGDAAFLAEPRDTAAFAQAVVRIVTDDVHRLDLTNRGLTRSQQFTWESTARATLEVYRKV